MKSCIKNKFNVKIISFILGFILFNNIFSSQVLALEKSSSCNSQGNNKKVVYLTFDDGPSPNNTKKIIDILNKNKVKATFFVIGSSAERNPEILKELIKNNMCVLPHTYSHNYKEIFKTPESYVKDVEKCRKVIEKIINRKVSSYVRVPGGINNRAANKVTMKKMTELLRRKNINYVEWNISAEDSIAKSVPVYKIRDNVLTQSKRLKNKRILVVLMHDSYHKNTTVEALSNIIKYYKDEGYVFKTFNNISLQDYEELVRHKVINRQVNIDGNKILK